MRQEARAVRWAAGKGISVQVAKALLWIVKLAGLGLLLYGAFWLAVLLAFAMAAAWFARHAADEEGEQQPEWRDGLLGFGLYDSKELRIDPHDPDEQP